MLWLCQVILLNTWLILGCTLVLAFSSDDAKANVTADSLFQGYHLNAKQVVINQAEEWQVWEAAPGIRVIEADGTVRPRLLRKEVNAVRNAGDFERVAEDTLVGGIWSAGSNFTEAVNIIDGDVNTYWEPDHETNLDEWFVEVDLGRSVIAKRIIARFVDAGQGDPFLKFRVLISDGIADFGKNRKRRYVRVGQVIRPNKDQREFVFDLEPLVPVPDGVEGELAQFVRFDALASDGDHGREITREAYERRIDPADRGAIDFFRLTISGREIPIASESYELLTPEEQGPVRYYRRERPRLAELEVWTLGDNVVTLTQRERFSQGFFFDSIILRYLTDGLYPSSYYLRTYDALKNKNQVEIDLGAKYWLDRIRLLSPQDPPIAYQVRISDGTLEPGGDKLWQAFDERLNTEGFLQLEERFPIQEVRYLELRRLELVGAQTEEATISEIQAYGRGYVSDVVMKSPLIRLGRPRILTTLDWYGEEPLNTSIEIRTRSGDDLLQITRYFDRFGRELSKERWEASREENRGEIIVEEYPGPLWSNWSEVYTEPGKVFKSPNPRQYVQIQVRLRSTDPERAALLSRVELNFEPPLVNRVLAEIWPIRGIEPGIEEEFTLYIKPFFVFRDLGFDRLRLRSSSSVPLTLSEILVGSETQLRIGAGRRLDDSQVSVDPLLDGGVEVRFDQPVRQGGQIYAIKFKTRVFLNSTVFSVDLASDARPGVIQPASAGNASDLGPGQGLIVVTDLRHAPLLGEVVLTPQVFTPNGDGINDNAILEFSVFRLDGEGVFAVGIYDLGGKCIRDLSRQIVQSSGRHRFIWDGYDERARRVVPGIYIVRAGFDTEASTEGTEFVRSLGVSY